MIKYSKQSRGFSLVELLVAMVVGLIIVSGAFSLHSGTRKTQVANEMQMDMVADARFSLELIAYDLRHSGMWGGTNSDNLIECKSTDAACTSTSSGDTPPIAVTGDCAVGWYYDLSRPVFATDGSEGNPYALTCISSTEGYVVNSDILEIKYADSNVPVALLANQTYIRSNFVNGRIFVGQTPPALNAYEASDLTRNHKLHAYAYYVSSFTDELSDAIPSLRRVSLVNAQTVTSQILASGVADMQVQFGEDLDGDFVIDRYVDPDDVGNWRRVYSAKIWLLMRSDRRQLGINTARDFTLAGVTATYGGEDDFRYFLATSVVNLRNLKQL